MTLRRDRDAAEYRETLEYLREDVDRLERLGESLLLAARTGEDDLTVAPTPLRPLIQQTLDQLHEAITRADLRVTLDLPEDAHATLDELATSRVLTNLITNALAHAQATQLTIALAPDARAGRLVVHVTDDGVGVPVALRPHLFTPFQRGDRNRGHGLGLFIARRLMRQQGGDLTLGASPDGKGTRWTLSFPA